MAKGSATDPALESPFHQYFNTNYIPNDGEIKQIRAHLVPHEAKLARLEALIQRLTAQRDRVKNYIEPHRALISHPRRLPLDIIEEIFLNCLPTHHNAIMSAVEAPLVLGRICSAWRSIAFSMPRLWTSLHISTAFVASRKSRHLAMLDWLERSSPLPLTLSVTGDEKPDDLHILHSLLQFSPRWGTLRLSNILLETVYKLADVHVSLLTEIQIMLADEYDGIQPNFLTFNLFRTTKAGRIIISGTGLGVLVPKQFIWDNFTHISLDSESPIGWEETNLHTGTVYWLLKGCRHLMSLHITLARTSKEEQDAWPDEILVAKSLESLIILRLMVPPHELAGLVDHLEMPRLRQFHVPAPVGYFEPNIIWQFPEHLASNSPLLSDLRFLFDFEECSHLIASLQQFPHLTKLSLSSNRPEEKPQNATFLFTSMSPGPDTPIPLPALKELEIIDSIFLEEKTLHNFIETRLEFKTNLRYLRLSCWDNPSHAIAELKSLRACGLDVSITRSGSRPTYSSRAGIEGW